MSRVISIEPALRRKVGKALNPFGVEVLPDGAIRMPAGSDISHLVEIMQLRELQAHIQRNADRTARTSP